MGGEPHEFTVIGQATADGKSAHDFCWITHDMLEKECPIPIRKVVRGVCWGKVPFPCRYR
jgi:hypothetical protein